MQEYKLKRGFTPDIERMRSLLTECFGSEIKEENKKLVTSYGVLKKITVWIDNKKLCVDTVSDNAGASDNSVLDTNKRFRTFLDKATGYSSKDRVKNAKKEVGGED
ncbi:DUF5611 family protein [Methanolapillus millepedarum]|uniref:DUF5611 domain-containing protein n=1 Tax=Methanolapillus millepedarum TaxID=3028296 RepID=A0AA96ZV16_9EURY|nr:hypothetical protein MsAc7_17980 [Methanosarcinaceae archaeon Ac7]